VNKHDLEYKLEQVQTTERIKQAYKIFGEGLVMSTSFGIQSAVLLHLATREIPQIPVIWVDTGYLPAETYHYAEVLRKQLMLNLKIYQSVMSPARMEALKGRLYETGLASDMEEYNQIRKVRPLKRALAELNTTAWLSGVRSNQTNERADFGLVEERFGVMKIHPILYWTENEIEEYLTLHNLPRHPLEKQGYVTVGDWHSSRPLSRLDLHQRETRYGGIIQECGLHANNRRNK